MKHFYAPDGRLVVCLNAASVSSAMTRGYRAAECIIVGNLSQLNDIDAQIARAAAAAAGGGTRRPPAPAAAPPSAPPAAAAPTRPAAVPAGRDGAVPGSASAAPPVSPANPSPMPCRAEATASASTPAAQPNATGSDAAPQLPIPDAEFIVERVKLLGDPGKMGSAQFHTFQSKLRTCVEEEVVIDDATKFGPILSWKGLTSYKSKPFRTEALQIHTFLCICSARLPAGDHSYSWSDLRNRARAYGQENRIADWAVALRTCIRERGVGGAQGAPPASEQQPAAASP